jgi:DNA-binding CsgD family transcriptional regulator
LSRAGAGQFQYGHIFYICIMSFKKLLLLIISGSVYLCRAQSPPADEWIQLLSSTGVLQSYRTAEALDFFKKANTGIKEKYLAEIKKVAAGRNKKLAACALLMQPLLAEQLQLKTDFPARIEMQHRALALALQLDDEYLLADCLQRLGDSYNDSKQNDKALLYLLKSFELKEKLGFKNFSNSNKNLADLGGVFFKAQEYGQCIRFTQAGLQLSDSFSFHRNLLSSQNLIAISYQRKKQYDSAAIWFDKAMQSAIQYNDTAWVGIVKGNTGYLKMEQGDYAAALPLMWEDYRTSLSQKDTSNAGNTLQRIAFIYQQTGKKDSALLLARLAYAHILNSSSHYNPLHRMNAGKTLAEILQQNGNAAEAIKYLKIYHHLKDSAEALVAASRLDRIQLQIGYEKSAGQISDLKKQNRTEKQRRQLLITALLLLLASGTLFTLWTRQKNQLKAQQLLQEKKLAEAESKSANERLTAFTQNIIEKNELIEKLELQLQAQNQQVNEALLTQTILTDEDWRRFREMFTQVYPGFFKAIQQSAPGITAAELRMAAVIKLGLGNKYIASMLGVSGDTVRKSKFRLRQRLQLTEDSNLEAFIMQV